MKHEIINLQDVQVIGMAKEIQFNHPEECTKFWGEYVERIVKPVYMEGKTPDEFQQAAVSTFPMSPMCSFHTHLIQCTSQPPSVVASSWAKV